MPLAALRGFVSSFSHSYSAKGLGGFGVACSGDQYEGARWDDLNREIHTRSLDGTYSLRRREAGRSDPGDQIEEPRRDMLK